MGRGGGDYEGLVDLAAEFGGGRWMNGEGGVYAGMHGGRLYLVGAECYLLG